MFTSRAELRLSLREDNADMRLTDIGRQLGCVDDRRWDAFCRKRDAVAAEVERLRSTWVNPRMFEGGSTPAGVELTREQTLADLLRRPEVGYRALTAHPAAAGAGVADAIPPDVAEQVEIQIKYAGYIARQAAEVERSAAHDATPLPADLDYGAVAGLSTEVRLKLSAGRPATLGAASRMSGITPAAIALLLVHLKKNVWGKRKPTDGHKEILKMTDGHKPSRAA
jgi:tRNA uridine 5-carboxymethylaminomethyl modification enzyme